MKEWAFLNYWGGTVPGLPQSLRLCTHRSPKGGRWLSAIDAILSFVALRPATEDSDNPFTRGGVLSLKADFIIRHSTFSRTGLRILDPDCVDSGATEDDEPPDPLPFSPIVSDRDDPQSPPAQVNEAEEEEEEEEEEGAAGLSDGEKGDEPCSVTTSLVSPTDRDLDQAIVDSHLARLNGKHPTESGNRVISTRSIRYESSSPAVDSGTVSSRTKKCSCCLLQWPLTRWSSGSKFLTISLLSRQFESSPHANSTAKRW